MTEQELKNAIYIRYRDRPGELVDYIITLYKILDHHNVHYTSLVDGSLIYNASEH